MNRIMLGLLASLLACRSVTVDQEEPQLVTVRACSGPAVSLDATLAANLPARNPQLPDDRWANIASTVPGGFAGIYLDEGKPILALTQPEREAEAKAALATLMPWFDIAGATVRPARWTFAQLFDWYEYLASVPKPGLVSADKDELLNRVNYGVRDATSLLALARTLQQLGIPCDLVVIRIEEPARTLGH